MEEDTAHIADYFEDLWGWLVDACVTEEKEVVVRKR